MPGIGDGIGGWMRILLQIPTPMLLQMPMPTPMLLQDADADAPGKACHGNQGQEGPVVMHSGLVSGPARPRQRRPPRRRAHDAGQRRVSSLAGKEDFSERATDGHASLAGWSALARERRRTQHRIVATHRLCSSIVTHESANDMGHDANRGLCLCLCSPAQRGLPGGQRPGCELLLRLHDRDSAQLHFIELPLAAGRDQGVAVPLQGGGLHLSHRAGVRQSGP